MKKFVLTLFLSLMTSIAIHATAIGQWKYYLGYQGITYIEPAGSKVFVLANGGLYAYNLNDNSITTYDRLNTLNDTDISFIAWCESAKKLVIVYSNYNIDLLSLDDHVTNISDYYSKNLNTGKRINNVTIDGNFAYLTTQFGIIKLNVKREEFADTYNLGINVNDVAIIGNKIYASSTSYHTANTTKNGSILCGDMNDNLLDKTNWSVVDTLATARLFQIEGQLIGAASTYTLRYNPDNFTHRRIGDNYSGLQSYRFNSGRLYLLCSKKTYYVDVKNDRLDAFNATDLSVLAYDKTNNCFWANQTNGALQAFTMDEQYERTVTTRDIMPDGPKYNYFFAMRYYHDRLYTCGGAHINQGFYNRPGTVQVKDADDNWQVYQDQLDTIVPSSFYKHVDVNCFAIDPDDDKHVFFGSKTGLYEYYDGMYKNYYTFNNSPLQEAYKDAKYRQTVVDGLIFDTDGSLIVANSFSPQSLFRLSKDGEWQNITPPEMENLVPWITVQGVGKFDTDQIHNLRNLFFHKGYLWIANESWKTKALIRVDLNAKQAKLYNNFTNQDGGELKADFVSCATPDKEGNIWIGTKGGLMMLTAEEIDNDGSQLIQVKVPRNDGTNLADYLLENLWISCIAIDDADRKWIGTYGDGVYLINADNTKELQHFTASNSPLISNNVESIAINNATGEVFIGSGSGLCSYMSDTVTPAEELSKDNVYAYPNPVNPDFTGLITVTGLTNDADVKIVTANGSLVAQGRSSGGIFTWDGNDLNGDRVATGVYMVLAATAEGKKGIVCKIAVVN